MPPSDPVPRLALEPIAALENLIKLPGQSACAPAAADSDDILAMAAP
jgi:hypothetical protein